MADFVLYGPTGYTGTLIARAAATRGLRPLLAGRDGRKLAALGQELNLPWRAVPLDDAPALDRLLQEAQAVLHCAGPYRSTSRPMADACLRTGTHYLDLAGEVDVVEQLAARDAEARAASVVLLPGVGYDFVPTDCLAVDVAGRLPGATRLLLAVQQLPWRDARGRLRQPTVSRGTLATLLAGQLRSGLVCRGGRLTRVPLADRVIRVELGAGPMVCTRFPFAEVAACHRSTGVPDVEAYLALPLAGRLALRWLRGLAGVLRVPSALLPRGGPSADELAGGVGHVWAAVEDAAGRRVEGRLRTPNAYAFTVDAALAAVAHTASGKVEPGFRTPGTALGMELLLGLPGVARA